MLGRTLVLVSSLAVSSACFAQGYASSTVGEIMKQGFVKMTKEEVTQMHAGGVTQKGALANGTPYTETHKPDGSVGGNAGNAGQFSLSGNWKIDDAGKLCVDVAASGGLKFNNCNFLWQAGGKYFFSADDKPETVARERSYTK